jgi:phenylpropionate dioxygenase-like ring-hydroxylating dioxygenase large terminal subunit
MRVQPKRPEGVWSDDDVAALGTGPVPAAPYHDPHYFDLERRAVFLRHWLLIGHVCELPKQGDFIVRAVEIAETSILLTHGKDGRIRAFHNVCTHRGSQLVSAEVGHASSFTCPYHAWTFGYDGKLRAAPSFEHFYVDKADCSLPEVSVDVCAGLIFINFEKAPKIGLRDFLGEGADKLEPLAHATGFSEFVYDIDANWKVNLDNFQENYHLRFVHSVTGGAAVGPGNPFGYATSYRFFGPHRSQTLWREPPSGPPAGMQGLAFRNAAVDAAAAGYPHADMKLFPNLHVVSNGGFFFIQRIMPVSARRSRCTFRMFWVGEDATATRCFSREYVFASVRDIITEDRAIVTSVQKGLNSGALEHIHFQQHEIMCRHLYRMVDDTVQAYAADCPTGAVAA